MTRICKDARIWPSICQRKLINALERLSLCTVYNLGNLSKPCLVTTLSTRFGKFSEVRHEHSDYSREREFDDVSWHLTHHLTQRFCILHIPQKYNILKIFVDVTLSVKKYHKIRRDGGAQYKMQFFFPEGYGAHPSSLSYVSSIIIGRSVWVTNLKFAFWEWEQIFQEIYTHFLELKGVFPPIPSPLEEPSEWHGILLHMRCPVDPSDN